jgi:hypothetical protein
VIGTSLWREPHSALRSSIAGFLESRKQGAVHGLRVQRCREQGFSLITHPAPIRVGWVRPPTSPSPRLPPAPGGWPGSFPAILGWEWGYENLGLPSSLLRVHPVLMVIAGPSLIVTATQGYDNCAKT